MRKAICPQPSKRVYFIKDKNLILDFFKNLTKIISFSTAILIVSGFSFQAFAESGFSGFPALNVSSNGKGILYIIAAISCLSVMDGATRYLTDYYFLIS